MATDSDSHDEEFELIKQCLSLENRDTKQGAAPINSVTFSRNLTGSVYQEDGDKINAEENSLDSDDVSRCSEQKVSRSDESLFRSVSLDHTSATQVETENQLIEPAVEEKQDDHDSTDSGPTETNRITCSNSAEYDVGTDSTNFYDLNPTEDPPSKSVDSTGILSGVEIPVDIGNGRGRAMSNVYLEGVGQAGGTQQLVDSHQSVSEVGSKVLHETADIIDKEQGIIRAAVRYQPPQVSHNDKEEPWPDVLEVAPATLVRAPRALPQSAEASSKPVRGRVFTEPAWKTAQLVPSEPTDDLSQLERRLGELRSLISDLDGLFEQRLRERELLLREIKQLEARQRPLPERIPVPPWMRSVSQNARPPVPPSVSSRFIVECERLSGESLGLKLRAIQAKRAYLVEAVKETGAVPRWNRTARLPVRTGCFILSVNGKEHTGEMHEELATSSFLRIVVEQPSTPFVVPSLKEQKINRSLWPVRSVEVHEEIIAAIRNRFPKTGLMRCDDVPVRLPDEPDGSYRCAICQGVILRNEQEYVSHFRSQKHEAKKDRIQSNDFWTRCLTENGQCYWYEHVIGVWSTVDPSKLATGCHTVFNN
jgi:hypothetical protein